MNHLKIHKTRNLLKKQQYIRHLDGYLVILTGHIYIFFFFCAEIAICKTISNLFPHGVQSRTVNNINKFELFKQILSAHVS